jgi:hypothetical protein
MQLPLWNQHWLVVNLIVSHRTTRSIQKKQTLKGNNPCGIYIILDLRIPDARTIASWEYFQVASITQNNSKSNGTCDISFRNRWNYRYQVNNRNKNLFNNLSTFPTIQ